MHEEIVLIHTLLIEVCIPLLIHSKQLTLEEYPYTILLQVCEGIHSLHKTNVEANQDLLLEIVVLSVYSVLKLVRRFLGNIIHRFGCILSPPISSCIFQLSHQLYV